DGPIAILKGPRLLPDIVSQRGLIAREDGYRRMLVDRMRIIAREDGSLERATELLPMGIVAPVELPTRLGGGFLFYGKGNAATQIWRATSWLAKLEPVVQLPTDARDIIPGFDRLYVRLNGSNRITAIDPKTGESMPLGPLPAADAYGALAF